MSCFHDFLFYVVFSLDLIFFHVFMIFLFYVVFALEFLYDVVCSITFDFISLVPSTFFKSSLES